MKRFSILFLIILLTCGSTALAGSAPPDVSGSCSQSDKVGQRKWIIGGSRLGVRLQRLTPQLAEFFGLSRPAGALISWVEDGSPAQKAGLLAGDVILSVGGERVEDASDATWTIWRKPDGPVEIIVMRDKQERTFTAELEKGTRVLLLTPRQIKVLGLTPRLAIPAFKFRPPLFKHRLLTRPITRVRPLRVAKPFKERPKIKVRPTRVKRGTVLL
ncbi:MAG TPA: PDZ domain-containing protein [Blastocatellia bacterium]|nr:PDZ domain-containing protein [Blastocatellia bacterium]